MNDAEPLPMSPASKAPVSEMDFHLDLPTWDKSTPLRPPVAASWEGVMAHFQVWVDHYQTLPNAEAERLRTKVDVPFTF